MQDNTSNHIDLEHSPMHDGAQDDDPWTVIPIAVRQSFKDEWLAFVLKTGLKPSQYGRMVLHDDYSRKVAA